MTRSHQHPRQVRRLRQPRGPVPRSPPAGGPLGKGNPAENMKTFAENVISKLA